MLLLLMLLMPPPPHGHSVREGVAAAALLLVTLEVVIFSIKFVFDPSRYVFFLLVAAAAVVFVVDDDDIVDDAADDEIMVDDGYVLLVVLSSIISIKPANLGFKDSKFKAIKPSSLSIVADKEEDGDVVKDGVGEATESDCSEMSSSKDRLFRSATTLLLL